MVSRVCPWCNKAFEVDTLREPRRRYCSPQCYYEANVASSVRRSRNSRQAARHAWAGDEAAKLYELAQQGIDKLEDYVYNTYNKRSKGESYGD